MSAKEEKITTFLEYVFEVLLISLGFVIDFLFPSISLLEFIDCSTFILVKLLGS